MNLLNHIYIFDDTWSFFTFKKTIFSYSFDKCILCSLSYLYDSNFYFSNWDIQYKGKTGGTKHCNWILNEIFNCLVILHHLNEVYQVTMCLKNIKI